MNYLKFFWHNISTELYRRYNLAQWNMAYDREDYKTICGMILADRIPYSRGYFDHFKSIARDLASHCDNVQAMEIIVNRAGRFENYELFILLEKALKKNHFAVAEFLYARFNINIDQQGYYKRTYLNHLCFTSCEKEKKEKAVQWLLNKNAQLDIEDNLGHTALDHACFHNHLHIVKLLVQKGALTTSYKPLVFALNHKNCLSLAIFLLESGAQINNSNLHGDTALQKACSQRASSEIVTTLLYYGANKNHINGRAEKPIDYAQDLEVRKILLSKKLPQLPEMARKIIFTEKVKQDVSLVRMLRNREIGGRIKKV
jgi:ankyrin repeat protein